MKQSELFTKTFKQAPKDEVSKNAQLLIRAGYINKEMAGVYDFLPLGLRVLNKIIQIIREEMDAIGGQEILMSSLQRQELWEKTDRWDDKKIDAWFKTTLKDNGLLGLAFTHEEPITNMMEQFLPSYQNLPVYVYQFQTKFRNETRAKNGLLRTKEFIMKDLYSFSKNSTQHLEFYEKAILAYKNIFSKVGIGDKTYITLASGGSFSKFSHEFQVVCDAGEDIIYIPKSEFGKGLKTRQDKSVINKEVFTDDVKKDLGINDDFIEAKAIEVGNIFTLGTRFSEPLLCRFKDSEGNEINPFMGSYGIGPARLMATIVELFADEKGIIWPKTVSPFDLHLLNIAKDQTESDKLYKTLQKDGFSVLYDQRDVRPGEKFADSDLIGIPTRILVSDKTLKEDSVEIKERNSDKTEIIKIPDLTKKLKTA